MDNYRVTVATKFYSQYVAELDADSEAEAKEKALAAFDKQYPCYRHCRFISMISRVMWKK